jgi:hypothetical protein
MIYGVQTRQVFLCGDLRPLSFLDPKIKTDNYKIDQGDFSDRPAG